MLRDWRKPAPNCPCDFAECASPIYEMREHSKGYTVAVVVIGLALPSYNHNFPVMAAAIVLSLTIGLITHCLRTRAS
jgi:hypothetical protein